MPNTQSRTNVPFLQKGESIDNFTTGRFNTTAFQHNLLLGSLNSAGSNTIISGDNNIVADIGKGLVIGDSNNIISTGIIVGTGNTVSTNGDVFLFGVNGMSITQSIPKVYMFSEGPSPTQSGIYLNENVFLGPSFSIFNSSGVPIGGSQNLNQVLTVGNSTGGQGIVMNNDQINDSGGSYIDFNSTTGIIINSPYIIKVGTNNEEDFRFNTYAFKEINIGDWDMTTTGSPNPGLTVIHGLSATEYKTIRNISVTIRDDNDSEYFDLAQTMDFGSGLPQGSINKWNSTIIELDRQFGGVFDSVLFDATSFNRGWIRFQYIPD